jgi:hypothetical protein
MNSVASQKRLLLACFPKSGSTLLALILASLPGFRKISLVPDYGRREQELALECLLQAERSGGHFVAQHHVRYSRETARLMAMFSLRPIVLVRNLCDVVLSIRDHLRTGEQVIAQAYVPLGVAQWTNERLEKFIVEMVLPWYFNFYASCAECANRVEVTYEDLVADPPSVVRQIRNQAGIEATDAEILAAVEAAQASRASTRFNVGLPNRGQQLSPQIVAQIRKLGDYYRFMDLSSLGL